MRIIHSTLGTFTPSMFDMTAVAANNYIPLIYINREYVREGLRYYNKPSLRDHVITKANTLKNIKDGFEMAITPRRININNKIFFIAKGLFLSETGIPLMVCAMKKEPYLDTSIAKFSDFGSDFSYNNYVLFYSTSFFTDPSLTPLNRRLQKEILQSCYEKGIEVRTITSLEIEKNTFARLFEVKKTKSLTQLEAYMEQVLPNFLHNDGEDNFIEQEFAPVIIHREEELSLEEEALLFDSELMDLTISSIQRNEPDTTITFTTGTGDVTYNMPMIDIGVASGTLISTTANAGISIPNFNTEASSVVSIYSGGPIFITEDPAHTVSQLVMPASHPADSLVERMRPLAQQYNAGIFQNASGVPINTGSQWQSVIELVDDTE